MKKSATIRSSKLSQALKTFTLKDYEELHSNHDPKERDATFFNVDGSEHLKISIANNQEDRAQAYRLLHTVYTKKDFTCPRKSGMWNSLFDAHKDTITFIVKDNQKVVGALSVIIDSDFGLPADMLYKDKLNSIRSAQRKPAEIISLGISEETRGAQKVLIKLFNFAYLASRGLYGVDDFVITVNPKHVEFYERKFHFETIGEERVYGKVGGAKAVLLNLNFNKIESFVQQYRSGNITKKNSIYRYFYDIKQKASIVEQIREDHQPMSLEEFRYFFADDLLNPTKEEVKHLEYLKSRFTLELELERV